MKLDTDNTDSALNDPAASNAVVTAGWIVSVSAVRKMRNLRLSFIVWCALNCPSRRVSENTGRSTFARAQLKQLS